MALQEDDKKTASVEVQEDDGATGDEGRMTLIEHLEELRTRVLVSFASWAIFSIAGWFFTPWIISYVQGFPTLEEVKLILISPPEAFLARMKTAMVIGLLAAFPILIYQVLAFIIPGLRKNEKNWLLRLVPASAFLFYAGAFFSLQIMVPITLRFFLVTMTHGIAEPQISLGEYVNFLVALVLLGGVVFQTPVILIFLTLIGVLSSDKLARGRKYAIIIIFIIAAMASPPDPFSQVVVAVPIAILYEACIWVAKFMGK